VGKLFCMRVSGKQAKKLSHPEPMKVRLAAYTAVPQQWFDARLTAPESDKQFHGLLGTPGLQNFCPEGRAGRCIEDAFFLETGEGIRR